MHTITVITCIFSLLSLSACSSLKMQSNHLYEELVVSLRKPGEKLVSLPDEVWQEHNCDDKAQPYLQIETFEVIPKIIQPGESFNLRLLYSLCTSDRHEEIIGNLYTRISFRGNYLINDRERNYAMKPGRWLTDTFIDLPSAAKLGVYSIQLKFNSPRLQLKEQASFVVDH